MISVSNGESLNNCCLLGCPLPWLKGEYVNQLSRSRLAILSKHGMGSLKFAFITHMFALLVLSDDATEVIS